MPTSAAMGPQTMSGNPSGAAHGGGNGNGNGSGNAPPAAVVPFIRASGLHRETMVDVTRGLTSSSQDLGSIDVPAYGYLRSVVFVVKATGGSGSGVKMTQDGPWSVLDNVLFQEPDGSTILQYNSGYDLYLANKYGGYRAFNDPKNSLAYSAPDSDGNFAFLLRMPLELSARDGLGSLPNENSAAQFQVRASLVNSAKLYSTAPSTLPSINVRMYIEAWDQPQVNNGGVANETEPPAVNTTQYWNPQQYNITAGEASPRLTRMGNYIRNLIFVFRDSTGARTDDWPDPFRLYLDARPKDVVLKSAWKQQLFERYGLRGSYDSAGGPDTGVWPYDFCHEFDGKVGFENRDLWLPTLGSSRLEAEGNYPASGVLHVLTNDVSIAGTVFM